MDDHAVFDLYFRKNPFGGEYTVFAGLDEVISLLREFHFTDADVEFLQEKLPPDTDPAFFEYLKKIDASQVRIFAVDEGSIVFPAVPLIRIEGPLMIIQLLETPLLNLINYASLVTTNAARFRVAVGDDTSLLEFGLRRAQVSPQPNSHPVGAAKEPRPLWQLVQVVPLSPCRCPPPVLTRVHTRAQLELQVRITARW